MRGVLVVIGMLGACDTVYGLNGRGPKTDGGSSDAIDATAIDGAMPVESHDEDGDGKDDKIDDCPGTVDPEQLDEDGDGIGDVCDPVNSSLVPNHRLLFDPFTTVSADWNQTWTWTSDGETIGPPAGQPATDAYRLTHRSIPLVAGRPWSIEIGVGRPSPTQISKYSGVHPVDLATTSTWFCAMYFDGSTWKVTAGGQFDAFAAPDDPIILRTRGAGSSADTNFCGSRGGLESTAMLQPVQYPMYPQLYSLQIARFQFIDVIQ